MGIPLHVLVVEDSEKDALLLLEELQRGGYDPTYERVDTASAMTAALERDTWDIIFSDYSMAHFSGTAAFRLVKEKEIDVPFIFVSGIIGENITVEARKTGAYDYVMKGNLKQMIPVFERELREAEIRRERHRSEEALQRSEEHFQSLIENSLDIITVIDAKGEILYDSPSVERILGYRQGELVGQNILRYVHPDDNVHIMGMIREGSKEPGKSFLAEFRFRHHDGSWRLLESVGRAHRDRTGAVIGIINSRDITERKRMEEQHHLQTSALESAANAIVITSREGKIIWANPAFTRTTGYTLEEVRGQSLRLLKSGRQPDSFYENLWKTVLSGQIWQNEIINRRKDGSLYTEEMTITPVRNEHGEISHFIAIKLDITERKQMEEHRRKRVEEIEKFNRLAVGRELRMVELKRQVNDLSQQLGMTPPYRHSDIEKNET